MAGSIRRFMLSGALVGLGKVRSEILFEVTPRQDTTQSLRRESA
jgi:hypothetical protein